MLRKSLLALHLTFLLNSKSATGLGCCEDLPSSHSLHVIHCYLLPPVLCIFFSVCLKGVLPVRDYEVFLYRVGSVLSTLHKLNLTELN